MTQTSSEEGWGTCPRPYLPQLHSPISHQLERTAPATLIMSRHVQLSKMIGHSLLSTFRNDKPQSNMKKPVKQPVNDDDPPLESSEDEHQPLSPSQIHVDSSDDDAHSGNIKRTTFRRKTDSGSVITPGTANGGAFTAKAKDSAGVAASTSNRRSTRETRVKKRPKDEIEENDTEEHDLFASKKTKTESDDLAGEVGGHMNFERMLPAKPAKRGYGKKSQNPTPQAKFQKNRDALELTTPKERPKFKSNKYTSPPGSSPVANLKLPRPIKLQDGEFPSSSKVASSGEKSDPPRALDGHRKKQEAGRRLGKKGKISPEPVPVPQKPQFKMPDGYNDYSPSRELAHLDMVLDDSPVEQKRQLPPGMALCPMCDEQVEEKLLQEFSNGERMRLVRQVKFCRMHKKVSAQKTWDEKGYPVVDWACLQERIDGHHDLLKSIIMGTASHFGDLLEENIRTGQARTLLTTKDYLTPGYYGLRGMSVMTEAVTGTFSNLLRKRAPADTRISGRGYTGFVQSVLVPELAVKLIQEDLSLEEDQARDVLKESRAVGEILNDERRQSQSQAPMQMREDSPEEQDEDSEEEDNDEQSDGSSLVKLDIEQAADGTSDLSSPPSYSQRPTSAKIPSQEANDSDSDESLEPFGGRKKEKGQASIKKQENITLPSRSSPSSTNIKDLAPVSMEADDSDDLSSLPSL